MVVAGFVAPYLLDTTTRFVEATARLPGVRTALITCEPEDRLPPPLRDSLAGHWRIDDPLDPGQIAGAVQGLARQLGPVERLLAVLEQLQVQLARSAADAQEFSERAGFPLVVKPPAGAGAKSTFRLDDAADLRAWLEVA